MSAFVSFCIESIETKEVYERNPEDTLGTSFVSMDSKEKETKKVYERNIFCAEIISSRPSRFATY